MTSYGLGGASAPRGETGLFLWSSLLAIGIWTMLLLALATYLASKPMKHVMPLMIDARIVELPTSSAAPPVSPVQKKVIIKHQEKTIRHEIPKPVQTHKHLTKPKVKATKIHRHIVQPKPRHQPTTKPEQAQTPTHVPPAGHSTTVSHEAMGARAIYSPTPVIPDDLRGQAINEVIVARLHIHIDGTVTVDLLKPTHNPKINRIILDTLRTWVFFPAIDKGHPVASLQEIKIDVNVGD